jgi:hypothetical protein
VFSAETSVRKRVETDSTAEYLRTWDTCYCVRYDRKAGGNMHDLAVVGSTEPAFALDDAGISHGAQR